MGGSSGYKAATKTNKRIGQALRNLLCGARPYVSIGWLWAWGSAICFYYAALGHMFLLVGCGRGARPYVSIGWLCAWGSAIWFYYVPLRHMFVLVGCGLGARPYVSIVCVCVYVCVYVYMYMCICVCVYVCVCVCVTICFHRLAPSQGRNLLAL